MQKYLVFFASNLVRIYQKKRANLVRTDDMEDDDDNIFKYEFIDDPEIIS